MTEPHASFVCADQSGVFAFLADPATHGRSEPVKRIDTHGAVVFLAGPDVYKAKRAVRFSYMDFSTLEKRKAACETEIAVNRANAPTIYIGVVPVTRDAEGLHIEGKGAVVEWLVHMRRFDEDATLDRIVEREGLEADIVDRLTSTIVAAHGQAAKCDGAAALASLEQVVTDTSLELEDGVDIFASDKRVELAHRLTDAFKRSSPLLHARGANGQVRRCHGDLHLRNIAMIGAEPVLFDAIEFDEAIATTDILYDLAFLVMDLCERGLHAEADRLLNRYLWKSDDEGMQIEGLALMPFFLSLRAAIRAKVLGSQLRLIPADSDLRRRVCRYLDAALEFLDIVPPRLVAVGGLSGTGKSTLAAAISSSFGMAPGAVHLRSDIERKRLFRVGETERLPSEAYRGRISAAVYAELQRLAVVALNAGRSVIVDATWLETRERQAIEEVAVRMNVPFRGLWLEAPRDVLEARVVRRRGDASDATAEVVASQVAAVVGAIDWRRLDASGDLDALKAAALRACA
jgi:uncharacterized protein